MVAALEERVDLRAVPTSGRLRCGVDPEAAVRVSRDAPRANSKRRASPAREVRELWLSHPLIPGAWLRVWVNPATWTVAAHLEAHGAVDLIQRGEQLVEGVSQRVSDLRSLSAVIVSVHGPNPRLPGAAYVVRHGLLSRVRTTPPPRGAVVLEFADELKKLAADPGVRAEILAKIDAQSARRKSRAVTRLQRAAATTVLTYS
jgi:hypothetical protein